MLISPICGKAGALMYILNRKKKHFNYWGKWPILLPLLPLLVAKKEPTVDKTAAALAAIHPEEISTAAR